MKSITLGLSPIIVIATAVFPQDISVSPDSLYSVLYTGGTETQILTISNNGDSDLIFSITDEELGLGQRDAFEFLGNLDYTQEVSDVWGYSAPDGTELAIVGTYTGTSFVDASTDPTQLTEVAFISGPGSIWRDIKTFSHYAYIVTEGGGGLQIVDLADPMNPVLTSTYTTSFSSAHNLFIDESGFAYIVGSNVANGGLHILDLSNPENPIVAGNWSDRYVHDVYVRNDTAYAA
ncbi:MAG: choice-of-anchor B family protein, partial [Candidatus Marinimicrobia bacterium]|nr:choice-of-anchor B family protein [Candidatus Neomarinimicrobiota bacterium]